MGHHYVPQEYLRHFAAREDPSTIWQYSKQADRFNSQPIPIRSAAQARNYYFPEDEKYLAAEVESPAQAPLNKLRRSGYLTPDERVKVAVYIQAMAKRGPWARRRTRTSLPGSFAAWRRQLMSRSPDLVRQFGCSDEELIASLDVLEREIRDDPISDKSDMVKSQYSSGKLAMLFYSMQWVVLHAGSTGEYLTSDTPVFFTIGLGLEHQDAEMSVPLSPSAVLHASWRGSPGGLEHIPVPSAQIFKELNRRAIREAVRFVYTRTPYSWISKVALKREIGWWAIRLNHPAFKPLKVTE